MSNKKKAQILAPCSYEGENMQGDSVTLYPGVDCGYSCETCGWNPYEVERRMKTGKWLEHNGIRTLVFRPVM